MGGREGRQVGCGREGGEMVSEGVSDLRLWEEGLVILIVILVSVVVLVLVVGALGASKVDQLQLTCSTRSIFHHERQDGVRPR